MILKAWRRRCWNGKEKKRDMKGKRRTQLKSSETGKDTGFEGKKREVDGRESR